MITRVHCGVYIRLRSVVFTVYGVISRIVIVPMKQTAEKCLEWDTITVPGVGVYMKSTPNCLRANAMSILHEFRVWCRLLLV